MMAPYAPWPGYPTRRSPNPLARFLDWFLVPDLISEKSTNPT